MIWTSDAWKGKGMREYEMLHDSIIIFETAHKQTHLIPICTEGTYVYTPHYN